MINIQHVKSTLHAFLLVFFKYGNIVFFNLFEVAEPKMTSNNFSEPNLSSKKLCGTQMALKIFLKNPIFSKLTNTCTVKPDLTATSE